MVRHATACCCHSESVEVLALGSFESFRLSPQRELQNGLSMDPCRVVERQGSVGLLDQIAQFSAAQNYRFHALALELGDHRYRCSTGRRLNRAVRQFLPNDAIQFASLSQFRHACLNPGGRKILLEESEFHRGFRSKQSDLSPPVP